MPRYYIKGTKQATCEVVYIVDADDSHEALRHVYSRDVVPAVVGQPSLHWDVSVKDAPLLITSSEAQ